MSRRLLAAVFVGGCLGGLARYALTTAWPSPARSFPSNVLVVNVLGSFVLAALVVGLEERGRPTTYLRPFVGTGFCGAFTTFSSVAVAADQLAAHGRPAMAVGYAAATFAGGLGAAFAGVIATRAWTASRTSRSQR